MPASLIAEGARWRVGLASALLLAASAVGCSEDPSAGTTSSASSAASSTSGSGGAGGSGVGSAGGAGGTGGGCLEGATRPCYTGPAATEGVGICHGGVQVCGADGVFSGPCAGEVLPQPETCDTPEDDDCNGQVNESGPGCGCTPNETVSCYTGPAGTLGVGICSAGTKTCDAQGKGYGPCNGEVTPQPETCFDLVDDDCNGETNETGPGCMCTPGATVTCYTGPAGTLGVGACTSGTQACNAQGTAFGPCNGEVTPQPETCLTPVDDDCNGQVNEGGAGCLCLPGSLADCYDGPDGTLGVGACKGGEATCNALGTGYGACAGEVLPQAETCNTPVDDDCNGQVNEGGVGCVCAPNTIVPCYDGPAITIGIGTCKAGTRQCNALGTAFGACLGEVLPRPEDCVNNLDDNCNGQINEGCLCVQGQTTSCYTGPPGTLGVGICAAGTSTCSAQLIYGPCVGDVTPQPETCLDLLDNNCDGQVNEGGVGCVCPPGSTASCYDGPAGTSGVGACKPGTHTCNAQGTAYGACIGEVLPQPETCNTPIDDDCNGQVNEGGAGCVCAPNAVGPCYDGPAGTAGVGTCKSGTATCNGLGTGYGVCVGEVVPQLDNCASPVDADCNGVSTPCSGAYLWASTFGTSTDDEAITITLDSAGNVLLAGYLGGTFDFGCGPITGAAMGSALVVKMTPAGQCIWSKVWGVYAEINGIATDLAGNIYVTGPYASSVDFGGGPLPFAGIDDVFIAKLDPSGNYLWAHGFGDSDAQDSSGIAVDASGNAIIVGAFAGTMNFGGQDLTSAGGNDIFVAKFTTAGVHVWSQRYGDAASQHTAGVTTDASGAIYLTGNSNGTVDFGGGPLVSAGLGDAYLAKLAPNGAHVWSKRFGDAQDQGTSAAVIDPAGNLVVTGYFFGVIDFGAPGGALTSIAKSDVFIAKFSPDGTPIWSKGWGGASNQTAFAVSTDAFGNIMMTGTLAGDADFGGGTLNGYGFGDVYAAKYDPLGNFLWAKSWGDIGVQAAKSGAMDPAGNVYLVGNTQGVLDFGGGPLPLYGGEDMYIAKLAP